MSKEELNIEDYTHEKLIAAGYIRTEWEKEYPGWVTYDPEDWRSLPRVAFAGNDATMGNWIEKVSNWEKYFPDIYAWWIDPKQKIMRTKYNEILIKGEDPLAAFAGNVL